MSVEMTSKTKQQLRWLALTSNLALIVWIALWQLDLSPHPHLNPLALNGSVADSTATASTRYLSG